MKVMKMQDPEMIDLPPSRFFATEEYCKKRLELIAAVCDFFNADGIVFIVKVDNGQYKAVPLFGKYALMVNRRANYEYLMVDITRPVEEFPMFLSKTSLAKSGIRKEELLYNSTYIKMIVAVSDAIKDVLKKPTSQSDWREFQAREIVSTESKDFPIWQDINSAEELMIKIDLESLRVKDLRVKEKT